MFRIPSKTRKVCKSKSQSQNIRLRNENLHWKMVCCQKPAALMNVYKDWLYSRRPDQRLGICHSPSLISYFAAPWTWATSSLQYRDKCRVISSLMSWVMRQSFQQALETKLERVPDTTVVSATIQNIWVNRKPIELNRSKCETLHLEKTNPWYE